MSKHYKQLMDREMTGHSSHPRTSYSHFQVDEEKEGAQETKDKFSSFPKEFRFPEATVALNNFNFTTSVPVDHYSTFSDISPTSTMLSTSINPVVTTTSAPTPRNKKQKTISKPDSGLRRCSQAVLEYVKQKGVTSFDEVAHEMFRRVPKQDSSENTKKNIRRRVYDILNVLVAMEMVSKDRKEITWVGLPSEVPQEQLQLQQEKQEVEESIQEKTAELQRLIIQQVAYKNLLESKMTSSPQHQASPAAVSTIHLPFIAVRTSKNTVITHATSKDKLDHVFNFDQPFQIHDNMEVLMRMGMAFGLETNTCSQKNLEISRAMMSNELQPFLEEMAINGRLPQNHKKIPE